MGDLTTNFSRHEFACRCGCGLATIDYELLRTLEVLRAHFSQPITVTSGHRCRQSNALAGGSELSQHLDGRACDFVVAGTTPGEVQTYLKLRYPRKFGIGCYPEFTHLDSRDHPARWHVK